jgi:hypothetical protein
MIEERIQNMPNIDITKYLLSLSLSTTLFNLEI